MPVGSTKKPLSAVLIGTWELRSREAYTSNGGRVINPTLGTDPIALLVYDHDGHFAAQFQANQPSLAIDLTVPSSSRISSSHTKGLAVLFI